MFYKIDHWSYTKNPTWRFDRIFSARNSFTARRPAAARREERVFELISGLVKTFSRVQETVLTLVHHRRLQTRLPGWRWTGNASLPGHQVRPRLLPEVSLFWRIDLGEAVHTCQAGSVIGQPAWRRWFAAAASTQGFSRTPGTNVVKLFVMLWSTADNGYIFKSIPRITQT